MACVSNPLLSFPYPNNSHQMTISLCKTKDQWLFIMFAKSNFNYIFIHCICVASRYDFLIYFFKVSMYVHISIYLYISLTSKSIYVGIRARARNVRSITADHYKPLLTNAL